MVFVLSVLCRFGKARGKTCVHVNPYPIVRLMCVSSPSISESCPCLALGLLGLGNQAEHLDVAAYKDRKIQCEHVANA